jgi:hypothetical protein
VRANSLATRGGQNFTTFSSHPRSHSGGRKPKGHACVAALDGASQGRPGNRPPLRGVAESRHGLKPIFGPFGCFHLVERALMPEVDTISITANGSVLCQR